MFINFYHAFLFGLATGLEEQIPCQCNAGPAKRKWKGNKLQLHKRYTL